MRDKEKQAKEKLECRAAEWRARREEKRVVVDEEDILHVVSKWTGIPLKRMEAGRMQRLLTVESRWKGRHRPARSRLRHVQGVAPFARGFEGPAPAHRHFSFCSARPAWARPCWPRRWPNRCLATPKSLIQSGHERIHGAFNVSRLVGSPPGYVGYEEGGQLTEKSAAIPIPSCCSTKSKRRIPTSGTCSCKSSRKETDRQRRPRGEFPQHHHPDDLQRRLGFDQAQSTLGFSPITDESSYEKMREKIMDEAKRPSAPSS
jgi:ATP-dependent Clp protease ATP-binding subunit ClpC